MRKVDILIEHALIVTVDNDNRVLKDGAIAIEGTEILAIGDSLTIKSQYQATKTINGKNKMVMPGLIDSYHHAGHGMVNGISRTRLEPGLGAWPSSEIYFRATTPEWWHAEGLLTALERIKFGVTTGVTIMGGTPARTDSPIFAEMNAKAVGEAGTRSILGVGPPDPFLNLGHNNIGTFWENGRFVDYPFSYEQTLVVAEEVIQTLRGLHSDRIDVMLAIPYLCGMNPSYMTSYHRYNYTSDEAKHMRDRALEIRSLADRLGTLIHTHAAKGTFEWAQANYGDSTLQDILGSDVVFAHANGLTDCDMDIIKTANSAVTAVPFAAWNTSLGSCPLVKLIERDIRVAISTDGSAPFHISDLFIDLHRGLFLQWYEHHDMSLLQPGKALRLVTIEAAKVLGIDGRVGSLEPGKAADIIMIDLNQPHLVPFADPANMIAYYVRGNDVCTTIVNGSILMENRIVISLNEQEVLDNARKHIAESFAHVNIDKYLDHTPGYWQGLKEDS
jgi:cytosine/adenosine deaminase-related metal-dependent hydrolase